MRKLTTFFLTLLLVLPIIPSPSAADDISGALEKEMRAMVEKGIVSGYGEGRYAPKEKVTRGQFAAFLARALHLSGGTTTFSDVPPTLTLAPSINAAAQAGIISGYSNGKFGPDDFINREQMSVMIDNSLDFLKVSKIRGSLDFTDANEITSSMFRLAIAHMVGLNITAGIPNVDKNNNNLGTLRFEPKSHTTREQAAAFIYRMLKVAEKEEEPEPDGPFRVGTVDANGSLNTGAKSFDTYEKAAAAMANDPAQVIMSGNQIVKMNAGIVVAKPTVEHAATLIYDSSLKNFYFNVDAGAYGTPPTELEYVTSDAEKIEIKIAGKTGFVKHSDAYLLPQPMIKRRAYYSKENNGQLVHHLYNFNTDKFVTYSVGPAPSFMNSGVEYYSWDGVHFRTKQGEAGAAYQYFNMLSARAKTNYTAADLDRYIDQELARREQLPGSTYKDATKLSKLKGMGSYFKAAEQKYKINALLMLGISINESQFGMSGNALQKNNLFGLNVTDNNPENGDAFKTPQDSINSFANNFLNKKYIPIPQDGRLLYQNGAHLGNKNSGINVRYASDTNWGYKAAGHMYTLDKAMGGKDFVNNPAPYSIGLTTQLVNVRSGAGTSFAKQFTYPSAGYSVVIVDTVKGTDGSTWYKVLSDSLENEFSYIHSDYIKKINIAR
ncbi:S-layer homology domain-containing protein [Bacillus sp. PK3_68]|uniref:S-layer homology domain-containing protein n=1 Tax=Bacillus sp. PK3_68 TaxID=2027408 RepID=UPI0015FECACB|nr:S-layer homology domain-containing protein [Bacillus sp. PK3_68]